MSDKPKGNPIKVCDTATNFHRGHVLLSVADGKLDTSATGGWRVYNYSTRKVYLFPRDYIVIVGEVES